MQGDNGAMEFTFSKGLSNNQLMKAGITLTANAAERPIVCNIRLLAALNPWKRYRNRGGRL